MTELTAKEKKKAYNKIYHAAHYRANKEQIIKQRKTYYDSNAEKCRAASKTRYEANREQRLAYAKEYVKENKDLIKSDKLRRSFGIDLDQYNKLLELQQQCCAICDTHRSKLKRALAVDHDHNTGVIRGLLCDPCNLGIGKLRDSIQLIQNALDYLTHHERLQNERDII